MLNSISGVLFLGTCIEMQSITAAPVSAFMKDALSRRDTTMREMEGYAMGSLSPAINL
jgi:hypothetical protein